MLQMILRRLAFLVPLMFLVSVLVFGLLLIVREFVPGGVHLLGGLANRIGRLVLAFAGQPLGELLRLLLESLLLPGEFLQLFGTLLGVADPGGGLGALPQVFLLVAELSDVLGGVGLLLPQLVRGIARFADQRIGEPGEPVRGGLAGGLHLAGLVGTQCVGSPVEILP